MFNSIADYLDNPNDEQTMKGWERTGKMLLDFSNINFSHLSDLIIDSLCWDWCNIAGSHYFPIFLRSNHSSKWKKKGIAFLQTFKTAGIVNLNGNEFNCRSINKAIFYQSRSQEFRNLFNLKESIYIFISDEKEKHIIPLSDETNAIL